MNALKDEKIKILEDAAERDAQLMAETVKYTNSVVRRNEFLEKKVKVLEGPEIDGSQTTSLLYALPFVLPPAAYGRKVNKILQPPVVMVPNLERVRRDLAPSVVKKYETVFIYAAKKYYKWAVTHLPEEAKKFDDGAEWYYHHLAVFKAANGIPPSSFNSFYVPEEIYRWHRVHKRFVADQTFVGELAKTAPPELNSIEGVKEHFKMYVERS